MKVWFSCSRTVSTPQYERSGGMGWDLSQPPLAKRKKSAPGATARSIQPRYRPSSDVAGTAPAPDAMAAPAVTSAVAASRRSAVALSGAPRGTTLGRPSGRVDIAHGEADAALAVDLEHFHAHDVPLLELVAHALHPLLGDLRDVHQTVPPGENGHERAEVHQPGDPALVHAPHFHVGGDQLDPALRLAAGRSLHGGDLHGAVILDVDGGSGLLGNLADHRAALADDVADLLRIDLQGNDGRRPFGHVFARLGENLVHLAEDMQPSGAGLIERHLHDLARNARDLDVHLQGRDAVVRAGDLEIHVAQVILIAEDVRQHLEAVALFHQTHGDARHRRGDGDARIHQCETRAAHRSHGTRAVRLENFGNHADHIRKLLQIRHDGLDAALGQVAVTDLAALRRAHHPRLADAERRKIVMEHEGLFTLAGESVDDLRIASGAERGHHQRLSLAASEQRRTMSAREHAGANADGAYGLRVTAVDSRMSLQDPLAHQPIFQIEEFVADLIGGESRALTARELLERGRLDLADLGVTLLLFGDRVGGDQILLGKGAHRGLQFRVDFRRGPVPLRLAGFGGEFVD